MNKKKNKNKNKIKKGRRVSTIWRPGEGPRDTHVIAGRLFFVGIIF